MKKITLLFLATILTFVISSCSKTEEVVPAASIVGKWNAFEIGGISNTKTYNIAPGTAVKSGSSTITITPFSYEFKEDGTAIFGKSTGTYKLSADKKKVVLTSKDGDFSYEITSLTSTELKLSGVNLTKKAGANFDLTTNEGIASYLYAAYALVGGGGVEADITSATSLQGTIYFKK
jgi:hypothetical protein